MTRKHPAQELEEDVLVRTSNMGQGRSDYEAFHTLSPAIHLREIHTHDFFELYIHLNGFPRLYVDNKIVTLQRGSLMIFPPFVMHGIISQDTIRNYERVVLFISSGMLHQLGQGLLPLEQRLWTARAAPGIIISWMKRRFRCVQRALTVWRRTQAMSVPNRAWRIMPR